MAEIFLSKEQRAAAVAAQHEGHVETGPPSTSKRMADTIDLLENPPMSPSEGILKPISDAIGILIKQTSKVQDQQGEVLRRLAALEAAKQGDDM
eukprot:COSAG02_NODE_2212_length_9491_cov_210.102215_11_plen_94_part_00